MDLFLSILKSVIYGVIEGITEWLPISSTGHMILAEQVLKFGYTEDFMEMFRVVIQLGAILAVVVLYFHKLWPFCKDNGRDTGFAAHLRWPVVRLWFKIIAACVPAAVLAMQLDKLDAKRMPQRKEATLKMDLRGKFASLNTVTGAYYYKDLRDTRTIEEAVTVRGDWEHEVLQNVVRNAFKKVAGK